MAAAAAAAASGGGQQAATTQGGNETSPEGTVEGGSLVPVTSGATTPATVTQATDLKGQPKRLHVSNIPFRFRDPDLRAMFGVSRFLQGKRAYGGLLSSRYSYFSFLFFFFFYVCCSNSARSSTWKSFLTSEEAR